MSDGKLNAPTEASADAERIAEDLMAALRENAKELLKDEGYLFWDNGLSIIRQHITAALTTIVAELKDEIVNLQFQLKTANTHNAEHEADYLAVWKAIKQPDETVAEAAKRVVKELDRLRAEVKELREVFQRVQCLANGEEQVADGTEAEGALLLIDAAISAAMKGE